MPARRSARDRLDASAESRDTYGDTHGGRLVVAWVVALLLALACLLTLTGLESRAYPGAVEVVAVFGWVVLAALAIVMTMATAVWFWERDK